MRRIFLFQSPYRFPPFGKGSLHAFDKQLRQDWRKPLQHRMKRSYLPGSTTESRLEMAKLHEFEPNEQILHLPSFALRQHHAWRRFGYRFDRTRGNPGPLRGVIGEFNHNRKAYVVVQSLFDRVKIYTLPMLSLKDFSD